MHKSYHGIALGVNTARELPVSEEAAVAALNKIITEDGIDPDKAIKMQTYAANLRRKFPHMKPERVAKKVAEEFKLKLVDVNKITNHLKQQQSLEAEVQNKTP